jgi:hypothetical protein
MWGKKKIAGGGQKRTMGYLLHQGSIEWNALVQAKPDLAPFRFIQAFSSVLAELFHLLIKDLPLSAEEWMSVQTASGDQAGSRTSTGDGLEGLADPHPEREGRRPWVCTRCKGSSPEIFQRIRRGDCEISSRGYSRPSPRVGGGT